MNFVSEDFESGKGMAAIYDAPGGNAPKLPMPAGI
jgi:hypothetical protein